jgi:hypothetical protein
MEKDNMTSLSKSLAATFMRRNYRAIYGAAKRLFRNTLAICVLLVLFASSAYSQTPPKGIDWKNSIQSGRTQATSRHVPIMMFVAQDDKGTIDMTASLEEPRVTTILKHFVCVFISRDNDPDSFWSAFVPWIVPNARAQYHTPLLVFGDTQGKPRQDYRSEGANLKPEELLKHLQKVLKALAPDEAKAVLEEELKALSLYELSKRLSDSVAFLEKNLASKTQAQFVDEVRFATEICKFLNQKLEELKDKEKQTQAAEHLKELQKILKELTKFTGKEKDKEKEKYDDYLKKTREAVDKLTSIIPAPKIETETLVCKAIPLARQVATVYELEYGIKQLGFVTNVSFEMTKEPYKVENVEYKIAVFTITCDKNKIKKDEIEKVFKEHYYEAKWVTDK